MRRWRNPAFISGVALSVALAGCSANLLGLRKPPPEPTTIPAQTARQLTGPEISTALTGQSLYQPAGAGQNRVVMYFGPNGALSGATGKSQRSDYDRGKWRIDQTGQLCRNWSRWRGGRTGCYQVIKKNASVRLVSSGGSGSSLSGWLIAGDQTRTDAASLNAAAAQLGPTDAANTVQIADTGLTSPPASALQRAPATPLSAQEIQTTLSGNTVYERAEIGGTAYEAKIFFNSDGTMVGKTWGGFGQHSDSGTWRVTPEGEWCRTWTNKWDPGQEGCFRVARYEDLLAMSRTRGVGRDHGLRWLEGNQY